MASAALVGLDIGTSGIRAVQLKRDRKTGDAQIVRAASVELPRGAVNHGAIVEQKVVTKALKELLVLMQEGQDHKVRKEQMELLVDKVLKGQLVLRQVYQDLKEPKGLQEDQGDKDHKVLKVTLDQPRFHVIIVQLVLDIV